MDPRIDLTLNVFKVFGLAALSFIGALLWTPLLTNFLYKHKMWRKAARTEAADGTKTPMFNALHKERETTVPRMGGLLIWITTGGLAFGLYALSGLTDISLFDKLNFVSRNQTWLPLVTLLAAALLGLCDDVIQVYGRGSYRGGGMGLRQRIVLVLVIAALGAYWFHFRLGWDTLYLPGVGDITIGLWYLPLFVITMLAMFAGGVIDGLDGLAGGVYAAMFAAYGGIAFFQNQLDIAAFCAVVLGALLAFLWFNIPPARFYLGETGMLGLTTSITVVAFLTNSVAVLPIIAFLPAVEIFSVLLQFASKRWRGKKIFLIAPIHHHFEALGWPAYKVTMRFWVVGVMCAITGMVIALIGK